MDLPIYQWTHDNNTKLKDVKFELLRNGKNECVKDQTNTTSSSGEVINSKSVVKDLVDWWSAYVEWLYFQRTNFIYNWKRRKSYILDSTNIFIEIINWYDHALQMFGDTNFRILLRFMESKCNLSHSETRRNSKIFLEKDKWHSK